MRKNTLWRLQLCPQFDNPIKNQQCTSKSSTSSPNVAQRSIEPHRVLRNRHHRPPERTLLSSPWPSQPAAVANVSVFVAPAASDGGLPSPLRRRLHASPRRAPR